MFFKGYPRFGNQKHRTSLCKSTEVFASKVRNFYAKKSDVSVLPKPSPHHHKKKFCEKLPHFLHPTRKAPIKPGYFGCRIGCRKCRRFSKNFFYGGEYAYAPTYCRQRSPTQNGTGTSAGDLCAKTLKTHRGRTKFRVVFVDYPESRRKKAKPTDRAARGETSLLGYPESRRKKAKPSTIPSQ